ncbi:sigma-E factor negative regulatory protein [Methylotenera sp.]|uniref:sigma-E factor negative regulatory protein n=1 Tax=Methylotenera sp. TaxID=2051956 RepID=UPI002488A372|nr:sigma-E factor negative regulatory protein [Methylotenera sp.]MDI1297953.1 sigma-E factor negative regulatory protein [Methylotenera sp.]
MTEQISALLDDEIALEDAEHLMAGMQANGHGAEVWSQYHLIGDVMRGANALSPSFKEDLMAKIDLEPTVLSPNAAWMNEPKVFNETNALDEVSNKKQALEAKSKSFATNLPVVWSIAASCAAVMVVGWMVLQTQVGNQAAPTMVAQATPPQEVATLPVTNEQGVPVEYLMAHQASAPSASSYYIQSASYTE